MTRRNAGDDEIILGQKGEGKPDEDWILSIGRAVKGKNEEVKLNCTNPHVIFVCGTRGSGKSYTLGVLAEEIARKNSDIAVVIVDPIGVFWSMKYPNQEEGEVELLGRMGMDPRGMDNLRVFVPAGYKSEIPDETYDTGFSFQPSNLKTEDWCLTFGIDRYNPQGLLLERVIEKIQSGYTRKLGDRLKGGSRDVPPNDNFSIDDLLECINHDRELLSKERGFSGSTRRALTSRLTAAKDWGIFGKEKKLSDLIKRGEISVIDISFLPENIGSLVLGILARKILSARKTAAREEAVRDLKGTDKRTSGSIPPTWLMVDEAHSFAPSSGKTASTDPLVEYVKQGRRPGLSTILSTQQPSALNSKIISQLDILIAHRLTFDDDIKEVWKRMPTTLPDDLKEPGSLKRLPEGSAITADKEIRQAFVTSVRPRLSQHEGRERVTKTPGEEIVTRRLEEKVEFFEEEEVETLEDRSGKERPKGEEILAIPFQTSLDEALEVAESERKKLLRILWPTERVRRISKYYYPIWSALIDYYPEGEEPVNLRIQIDGLTGELIQKVRRKLGRTKGTRKLSDLKPSERNALFKVIQVGPIRTDELKAISKKSSDIQSIVETLIEKDFLERYEEEGNELLDIKENLDIPPSLSDRALLIAEEIPDPETKFISSGRKVERIIDEGEMLKTLEVYGETKIIERRVLYYPYWIAEMARKDGSRILAIDGVFGQCDEYVGKMLRRRIDWNLELMFDTPLENKE